MVTRFQLLPGAVGIDLPGGRTAKANSRGVVTVASDSAAQEIRESSAMKRYDAIIEKTTRFGAIKDFRQACPCGFAPWPWQRTCPRCGDSLT